MRLRPLAVTLLVVLAAGCGDDSGGSAPTTTAALGTSGSPGTGTVVGPTEGGVACADLADRYVARARPLFDREGTPSDTLVDRTRTRLMELDTIAAQAGCGEIYTSGVCQGLDALTQQGILVIFPLTTAQCL